jgi:hypothetical protein
MLASAAGWHTGCACCHAGTLLLAINDARLSSVIGVCNHVG